MTNSPGPPSGDASSINSITDQSSTALKEVSDFLGVLANISGAIAAVQLLMGLFISDRGPEKIQEALAAINAKIQQLNIDLGVQQILLRNTAINGYISTAYRHLQGLKASIDALNAQPPRLSYGDVLSQITDCVGVLDSLSGPNQPDLVWNLNYNWQVYWTDAGLYSTIRWLGLHESPDDPYYGTWDTQLDDVGYRQQAPNKNPDGTTVFSYIYSLPAYLFAVAIFLAVGGSLDPNFISNWSNILIEADDFLGKLYDNIMLNGITSLSPAYWTPASLTRIAFPIGQLEYEIAVGIRGWWMWYPPTGNVGGIIEYGAVEKFSGYSEIEPNYVVAVSDDTATDDPGPFNKLQLRILKKKKDVCMAVGLLDVWNVRNQLRRLVGQAPLPRPDFTYWSFRGEIIPITQITASNGRWSLKAIAEFIQNTLPPDTLVGFGTYSFRSLLNPIPTPPPPG